MVEMMGRAARGTLVRGTIPIKMLARTERDWG